MKSNENQQEPTKTTARGAPQAVVVLIVFKCYHR